MPTDIREATAADSGLILDFIKQLADYEKMSDEVVATEDSLRKQLFPTDGNPKAHAVLAYAGDQPVGFALYFYNFSTFLSRPGLYLEDLYVKPEYRGAGHGKALLLHLARQAHAEGCGRMEWTVLDWNTPSIDFYHAMGAQIMNEWKICRLDREAMARLAD